MAKSKQKSTTSATVVRVLFTALLLGSVVFIFYNSSEIGDISALRSATVTEWANRLLGKVGIGPVSELLIRKLGHFAEFCLLGFAALLTLRVYTKRVFAFISWPLLFGLMVAVADELFQRFVPGRTSDVVDVVLDFAGVLGGVAAALVILLIVRGIAAGFQK